MPIAFCRLLFCYMICMCSLGLVTGLLLFILVTGCEIYAFFECFCPVSRLHGCWPGWLTCHPHLDMILSNSLPYIIVNVIGSSLTGSSTLRLLRANRLQVTIFPKQGTSVIVKKKLIIYILGAKTLQVVE